MNSIATIGYTSNLYARDQKTINYFEFQAMLADQVSDRLHWYATIHPREGDDACIDAAERLSLCVKAQLKNNDKILIIGGDLTACHEVSNWLGVNSVVGIEGIDLDEFNGFLSKINLADVFKQTPLKHGFTDAAIGIWWPYDSVSMVTSPLPKQLKILYVPELVSKNHMKNLIQMTGEWL